MRSIRLAICLLCVPRLFATLLLLPLLLSILLVASQLLLTSAMLHSATALEQDPLPSSNDRPLQRFFRGILLGSKDEVPPARICRWAKAANNIGEAPSDQNCEPDRLDIALQVDDPSSYNPNDYARLFNGNVRRLHLCRNCSPDVAVNLQHGTPRVQVKSVFGLILIGLSLYPSEIYQRQQVLTRDKAAVFERVGEVSFMAPGLSRAVRLNDFSSLGAVVFNVACLIVISLWLALKAHRRVLDYFSRNGALLPMVAAVGHREFYSAIWILTMLRVGAFLLAAIPVTVIGLSSIMNDRNGTPALFAGDRLGAMIWLLALSVSLGVASMIASIADLKQRHHFLSFLYRYVPLTACFAGAVIWAASFLFEGAVSAALRVTITALPIVGLTPTLIAPMVNPATILLLTHMICSLSLLLFLARLNARWFAAHVDAL